MKKFIILVCVSVFVCIFAVPFVVMPINATSDISTGQRLSLVPDDENGVSIEASSDLKVGDKAVYTIPESGKEVSVEILRMQPHYNSSNGLLNPFSSTGTSPWSGSWPANQIIEMKFQVGEPIFGQVSYNITVYNSSITDAYNLRWIGNGFNTNPVLTLYNSQATSTQYARASANWTYNSGVVTRGHYLTVEVKSGRSYRLSWNL